MTRRIPPPGALRSGPAYSRRRNRARGGHHRIPRIQTRLVQPSAITGSLCIAANDRLQCALAGKGLAGTLARGELLPSYFSRRILFGCIGLDHLTEEVLPDLHRPDSFQSSGPYHRSNRIGTGLSESATCRSQIKQRSK
jgi:hypothetical protein